MSLLSAVEHAIKSYKVEQAKINDSIKLYREILHSLTSRPKADSKDSESEEDAAADTGASPKEREDIELLERALEKALRVRTGSEPRNKLSGTQRDPGTSSAASVDVTHPAAASKRSQATIKSSSSTGQRKPRQSVTITTTTTTTLGSRPLTGRHPGRPKNTSGRNIIPKHPPSSAGAVNHRASRKLQQQPVSSSGSSDHISTSLSKNKPIRSSSVVGGDDPGKAASVSTPSSNDIPALSRADGPGQAGGLLQRCGTPSEQAVKWKSLRSKQNRLWDKVIALQRKPEPGRGHFMERMRATFPEDWPYGSPDQTRALADRLTHRGHDLIQMCQAKELLAKRSPEAAAAPDDKESRYDSCLAPRRLHLTAAELQDSADQVKQNWKAWDRWRPEGGCLCPSGANGVWGDEITAPLPLTVTYTTEAELQELEKLRTSVALLQQEIYLEQALWDTLSPQLSSIEPGPGCPNPSVLRDLYSLLGEGGKRFPAIVLDSEPD